MQHAACRCTIADVIAIHTCCLCALFHCVYVMSAVVITGQYDHKADIWSLGCTVLEVASREHPFWHLLQKGHPITVEAAQAALEGHYAPVLSLTQRAFLQRIFVDADRRPEAAELLDDPYLATAGQ